MIRMKVGYESMGEIGQGQFLNTVIECLRCSSDNAWSKIYQVGFAVCDDSNRGAHPFRIGVRVAGSKEDNLRLG